MFKKDALRGEARVVLTNPASFRHIEVFMGRMGWQLCINVAEDMLHSHVLPQHVEYARLLQNARYIVLDEDFCMGTAPVPQC